MSTLTHELTLDDVVERLGKTRDYWARRIPKKVEHLRVGREIRLTEEQYEALRDTYTVRPELAVEPDPLREQTSRSRSRH
ncbi:hypothetical protein UQW22_10050 [Isoptericola halotolerans]|uniref:hypothetical protein n=1 Tax=Isoptericola halotolerans TaxID=300560 RepID=UPI00388CF5B8